MQKQISPAVAIIVVLIVVIIVVAVGYTLFLRKKGARSDEQPDPAEMQMMYEQQMGGAAGPQQGPGAPPAEQTMPAQGAPGGD